jgi:hypothetical protein
MNQPPSYPTYEQRTFNLYQIKENPGVEYLRHPSGVIILRVGADHECLTKEIQEISFEATNKRGGGKDLTKQVVIGKGKKVSDLKISVLITSSGRIETYAGYKIVFDQM